MPKRRTITPAVKAQIVAIRDALQDAKNADGATLDELTARAKQAGASIDRATIHAVVGARALQDFQISTLLDVANALGLTLFVSEPPSAELERGKNRAESAVHAGHVPKSAHQSGGPLYGDLVSALAKERLLERVVQKLGAMQGQIDALMERMAGIERRTENPPSRPTGTRGRRR